MSHLETSEFHWQMRPCVIRDGEPCLTCKEDLELEQTIQELQNRRRNLRSQMNVNHDPFILKFSPEIASHIFSLSMEKWDYDPTLAALYGLPTQFLLGTICRGWRQLARSTPQLWSTLSFTLGKPTKLETLPQLRVISDWLQLSASLPLTLWIASDSRISRERSDPIINTLNTQSARWSKVFLRLPAPYFGRFRGTSPPGNLRELRIINTSNSSASCSPTFSMTSRPSPTHLTIQNFPVLAIDFVWANLTFLTVKNGTFNGCMEVIRQTPLLEFCSLQLNSVPTAVFPVPRTSVRLTLLQNLELSCFPVELLIRFIDALELPSLKEYHFKSVTNNIATDSVVSLLNRSGSCLKKLSLLLDGRPVLEDLVKLLNAIPSVQTLQLEFVSNFCVHFIDHLLQRLSSSLPVLAGNKPGFLPQLQSLVIFSQGVSMWHCIPQIYSWPHRKLLSLEVDTIPTVLIDDDTLHKILQLIDDGINIRIFSDRQDYLEQFKQGSRE